MQRCVLILLILVSLTGLHSCARNVQSASDDAPELLKAVPSDALGVGLFNRLDHGMDAVLDSLSVLRRLDYGKLSRSKAAVAMCDVGSVTPLLVIEAGRSDADTLEAARSVLAMSDTLRIPSALVALNQHNVLLLSTSATVITVACRHIASESSILDAPDFDLVVPLLPKQDVLILRNRGASRLPASGFGKFTSKQVTAFIREAAEWTVLSEHKLHPVYPSSQRYFCSFMESVQDAPSKLPSAFPQDASAVIDMPVASVQEWRGKYEQWLDARIELENYRKRLGSLRKSSGKNPLDWEKEHGVREVALVMLPGGTVNMVRTFRNMGSDGVKVNPHAGFVRALYGSAFATGDSCLLRCGNWLISSCDRVLLDSLKLAKVKPENWPSSARVVAWSPEMQFNWTKDNINIWNSNQ